MIITHNAMLVSTWRLTPVIGRQKIGRIPGSTQDGRLKLRQLPKRRSESEQIAFLLTAHSSAGVSQDSSGQRSGGGRGPPRWVPQRLSWDAIASKRQPLRRHTTSGGEATCSTCTELETVSRYLFVDTSADIRNLFSEAPPIGRNWIWFTK